MLNSFLKKYGRQLTVLEAVLILILAGVLIYYFYATTIDNQKKDRDQIRIDDISQIQVELSDYHTAHGAYPACLYKKAGCTSLEGSTAAAMVPTDPLTGLPYSYAAYGPGPACTGYHLGNSLERTNSQALLTGSDSPPQPANKLCTGSAADFSGLSYVPGGQPCNVAAGIAQPTDAVNGETCYDVSRHLPQ